MAKKKNKMTQHGLKRIRERVSSVDKGSATSFFSSAIRYGKSPSQIKDLDFKLYIEKKIKSRNGIQAKVYGGFIFIYKNRKLITVYPVPYQYSSNFYKRFFNGKRREERFSGKKNKELMQDLVQDSRMFLTAEDIHLGDKIMMEIAEIMRRKYQINPNIKDWDNIEINEPLSDIIGRVSFNLKSEENDLIKIFELIKKWKYKSD